MSLRHAVLGLLAEQNSSGYELMRRFEQTMQHVWVATQSQLYTELNRLASDELIEVVATGARGRKDHAITAAGLEELRRWIVTPHSDPVHDTNLLKVFMLGTVDLSDAREYLQSRMRNTQAALVVLERVRDETPWDDSQKDRFARLALEAGLRLRASDLEWARWALDQLATTEQPAS